MSKIYAIVGPHASGKTELIRQLYEIGVPYITSHTTRKPRPDEKDGVHYHFVARDAFLKIDFVEKSSYQGEYYGVAKTQLLQSIQANAINTILLDQNGVKQLKKFLGSALHSIYLMVDYVSMVKRMVARGENNALMKKSLEYAEANGEFDGWKTADYVVKNSYPDATVNQVLAIMGLLSKDHHLSL